jgi:hypothetical protein
MLNQKCGEREWGEENMKTRRGRNASLSHYEKIWQLGDDRAGIFYKIPDQPIDCDHFLIEAQTIGWDRPRAVASAHQRIETGPVDDDDDGSTRASTYGSSS